MVAYAKVSRAALEDAGGRVIARGMPSIAAGRSDRVRQRGKRQGRIRESDLPRRRASFSAMPSIATFVLSKVDPERNASGRGKAGFLGAVTARGTSDPP
jgi:hypothetical protein